MQIKFHFKHVELLCLDTSAIIRWGQIFDEYQSFSYKEKIWVAAYVINGGCSGEGFTDFGVWLIVQGKEVFFNALNDPESFFNFEFLSRT